MDSRIDAKGMGATFSAQLGANEAGARKNERQVKAQKQETKALPPQVARELVEVNKEAARAFLDIGEAEMPKFKTFERPEIDKLVQNIRQNPEQALASQANMRRDNVLKIIMPS